jgi:hypothetical protein
MILAAKPNPVDKLAWVGLIVLGVAFWWPLGLAILAYLIWSGKMKCWYSDDPNNPQRHDLGRFFHTAGRGCCDWRRSTSSGNTAFDEYRSETLHRLEEEQREFMEFLDRLRRARDRAEFDQFMAEQKRRRVDPEQPAKN